MKLKRSSGDEREAFTLMEIMIVVCLVGIVSAMAGLVASYGGNVTDLTTRLAGTLYVLIAEVELPADADVAALDQQLTSLAAELGVEATLRPAESDLL